MQVGQKALTATGLPMKAVPAQTEHRLLHQHQIAAARWPMG